MSMKSVGELMTTGPGWSWVSGGKYSSGYGAVTGTPSAEYSARKATDDLVKQRQEQLDQEAKARAAQAATDAGRAQSSGTRVPASMTGFGYGGGSYAPGGGGRSTLFGN